MKAVPFLVLLATALAAAPGHAQHPFPAPAHAEITHELWQAVQMDGTHIGHSHVVTYRAGEGDEVRIVTDADFTMTFGRMGTAGSIRISIRHVEDGAFRLREVEAITEMSNTPLHLKGVVEGDVLKVTSERMGRLTETELEWDDDVATPEKVGELFRSLVGTAAGTKVTYRAYDATIGQIMTYEVESAGTETIEHRGASVAATRIHTNMDLLPGMQIQSWLDANGEVIRERQPVAGSVWMLFETCPKEDALLEEGAANIASIPDLFASTVVPCAVPIPRPRAVDEVLYRLTLREGVKDWPVLPDDPRQQIEAQDEHGMVLRITRREPPANARTLPLTDLPADVAQCLEPNNTIESDDPELAAWARQLVGDETDAWTAACRLESWAHEHIEKKDMETVFASASEVFRERRGDCSEHAVLLAAMCRAVGIPARVVMGLEYVQGIFGGHAWNEVWIGDWYALDATNAYGGVDAAHLSLASSSMSGATGMEGFLSLTGALGSLEIEVLGLRYGERRVNTSGSSWIEIRDGEVDLTLLDVEIPLPAGWTARIAERGKTMQTRLVELRGPDHRQVEVHMSSVPYSFRLEDLAARRHLDTPDAQALLDGQRALQRRDGDRAEVWVLLDDTLFFLISKTPGVRDAPWTWFDELVAGIDLG